MIPFNTHALVAAINRRFSPSTPIFNRYFSRARLSDSNLVQLDQKETNTGIMQTISYGAQSRRVNRPGWESKTFQIPRFSEHDVVKGGSRVGERVFGSKTDAKIGLSQDRRDAVQNLLDRSDATREFMAIKALCGQVVDGAGTVIANYPITTVAGALDFAGGTHKPTEIIRTAKRLIGRELGTGAATVDVLIGWQAYEYFLEAPEVLALREKYGLEMLNHMWPTGAQEVTFQVIDHTYHDADGNDQEFFDPEDIVIMSPMMNSYSLYGPVETSENGLQMRQSYFDMWREKDPPAEFIRFESNPLPFMDRPYAIRKYTVTS